MHDQIAIAFKYFIACAKVIGSSTSAYFMTVKNNVLDLVGHHGVLKSYLHTVGRGITDF